jgi:hypothetical protein
VSPGKEKNPGGNPDEDPEQPFASWETTGIPDAYGQPGVTSISVERDGQDTRDKPRKLVRLETFACEIPLTLAGAEQLASRLYDAVYEVRRTERERARTNALASGEKPLESVRDALGTRAYYCLARAGVLTAEQAAAMTDAELLCIVNLGIGTLQRIREVVGRSHPPAAEAEK